MNRLSRRDRSLVTVAYLVARNRSAELPFRVNEALDSGVSRQEVIEVVAELTRLDRHPPKL